MQSRRLGKHGLCQHADADCWAEFRVSIALVQLANVQIGVVVRQSLRHPGWQRCLHLDVQHPAMFISRQNVQDRQLVVLKLLIQKRIQELYVCDLWLIDKNRIQKMDRHAGMLGTTQHKLECEIHKRTDAYCHVSVATTMFLAKQNPRTAGNCHSVASG